MALQDSYFLACPHCLEQIEVIIDHTTGSQEYVEDCEVCCKPIVLNIQINDGNVSNITAKRENE